jgi:hypothetical protein
MSYSMPTKGDTLEYLKRVIFESVIDEIFIFSVNQWRSNKDNIIEQINNRFIEINTLIVRSSAQMEDHLYTSGYFRSLVCIKIIIF